MKAEELRINSTYLSVKWKKPVRLELSDLRELYIRCEGAALDSEIIEQMFEPIELTEAILVDKLDFVYYSDFKHDHFWQHDECDYVVRKTGGKFAFCINPDECSNCTEYIMHTDKLHIFQNNFKALTGIELTIKL